MLEQEKLAALYAEFCEDMLAWVQAGCPGDNRHAFSIRAGLCVNLSDWAPSYAADDLDKYQLALFRNAGLSPAWPFDNSYEDYEDSRMSNRHYENTHRLQWLQDHAAQ